MGDFKSRLERFHEAVQSDVKALQLNYSALSNADKYKLSRLQVLYQRPINNEQELEQACWLYNYGNLRTDNEEKEQMLKAGIIPSEDIYYLKSGKYESDCFNNKLLWGFYGFSIPFFLILGYDWFSGNRMWIFSVPIGLILGITGMMIGSFIASQININLAEEHHISDDNSRYKWDKHELKVGKIAIAGSLLATLHHTKKAIKNVSNVDSWKEMK